MRRRIAHQIKQHLVGVIENMSDFPCPHCNELISLFGSGGGEETARRLSELAGIDVPLLGKVPFSPDLRTGGDNGAPVVVQFPDSAAAQSVNAIVLKLYVATGLGKPLHLTVRA